MSKSYEVKSSVLLAVLRGNITRKKKDKKLLFCAISVLAMILLFCYVGKQEFDAKYKCTDNLQECKLRNS